MAGSGGEKSALEAAKEEVNKDMEQRDAKTPTWLSALELGLWFVAACAVTYYGNGKQTLATLVLRDPRVQRRWLTAGAMFMAGNLGVCSFLTLYLPYIKGDRREWSVAAPWAIPAGAMCAVAAYLCYCIALWPIFGLLVIPIVLAIFMGFLFLVSLVPGSSKSHSQ